MKRAAHAVAETVLTALALAVFFVLLEMVKACRSSQWSGTTAQDALGFLAGMGLYCVAALTLLFTVRWLLGALRFGAAALPVATVIAGGLIWLLLSRYREVTPTPDDVLVIGGMLGFGMGLWLLPKTRRFGAAGVCALALTVLFAGGSSLVAAGGYFLFVPDRAKWVTFLPALWMLLVAIPGLGVWCYTRRARLAYAVAAVLLPQAVFALGVSGGPEEPSARPNIVFVVSDALRADYLRAYGGTVPTPHLEQFAQTGAFFEEAYSLAPWTLPSLTAMFASDYPAGLTPEIDGQAWLTQIWQYGLAPKSPTLAELLRKEGYATAAITSNALLWTIPGLMNGFDVTATSHPITLAQAGLFRSLPFLQPALAAFFPGFDQLRPHNASADVASYARAYLNRVGRQPFFLWLHYIDPHAPYDPPARYRSAEGPWPFFYPYAGGERWGIPKQGPGFDIAPGDRAYVQSLYEGEIRYVDELVGQVFAQLRGLGLDKNTYICFTSDHGEELWDHGDWGHGHAVYQEEVRVPLMLAGPGIRVQRVPGAVSALDLMPTLAELAGVTRPAAWKGQSLAPVLRGDASRPAARDVFVQGTSNRTWPHPLQTVISGDWKLIRKAGTDQAALYDLRHDPKEHSDLSAGEPERVLDLKKRLDGWLASFPSVFPAPEGAAPMGPEMTERLRGMGYL